MTLQHIATAHHFVMHWAIARLRLPDAIRFTAMREHGLLRSAVPSRVPLVCRPRASDRALLL